MADAEGDMGEAGPPDPAAEAPPPKSASRFRGPVAIALALLAVVAVATVLVTANVIANRPVAVPDLVGLQQAEAEAALEAVGLRAGTAARIAMVGGGTGRVVAQSPEFATRVPRGSAIDATFAVEPTRAKVPDVSRATEPSATELLTAYLFRPFVLKEYSGNVPIGTVSSQLPRAGQTAMTGMPVLVSISLGPGQRATTVPNLVGRSQAAAAKALAAARLSPIYLYDDVAGERSGTVLDQVPDAGARVPDGTAVGVAIARRP